MDDASTPGQKKPEMPRGEKNLLLRGEEEDVKAKLDWGVEGLRDDTPAKVKDGQDVAQEQQQVLTGVVKPKEEKTLGERFEELRRTRAEREIEKLRRKAQKAREVNKKNMEMAHIRQAMCYEEVEDFKKHASLGTQKRSANLARS